MKIRDLKTHTCEFITHNSEKNVRVVRFKCSIMSLLLAQLWGKKSELWNIDM